MWGGGGAARFILAIQQFTLVVLVASKATLVCTYSPFPSVPHGFRKYNIQETKLITSFENIEENGDICVSHGIKWAISPLWKGKKVVFATGRTWERVQNCNRD